MDARAATSSDVTIVFGHLANRMAAEYASAGGSERAAQDALFQNLKEGRAHALVDATGPVAIIAWDEDGGVANTSFAAAEGFFTASTVRFCRRHIRRIQALCGNIPIRSRSWSSREDVARWFHAIGFEKIDGGDGFTLYELPPR